jgi:nitroimidazol reductase NimA-like FMN-containing flavoprotein (pyridoxamine 5'-phosphate oxidase superfamily)
MKPAEIENLLNSEPLGRLGCFDLKAGIYVVPINYGYDGLSIYAHSKEGLKIEVMRNNPLVCFEIDRAEKNGDWQSVIVKGSFEEIKGIKAQKAAMKVFAAQMARSIDNPAAMPSHGFVKGPDKDNDPFKSVVFKILITEKSGRKQKRKTL